IGRAQAARSTAAIGRPSSFNRDIADELCLRLAIREPLQQICADPHMPAESTVYAWRQQNPEFTRARARPGLSREPIGSISTAKMFARVCWIPTRRGC